MVFSDELNLGITEQDKRIADYVIENHVTTLVVVNKWDLSKVKKTDYERYLRENLPFMKYIPILFASAQTGSPHHTTPHHTTPHH